MRTDPQALSIMASNVKRLREDLLARYPDLESDDQTLADTLEGATDFNEAIMAVIGSALNDEAYGGAIDTRIKEMAERKARLIARSNNKYNAARAAMEQAGIKKIEGAEATVSLRAVAPSVVVTDESQIPDDYKKTTTTVSIDKAALKAALSNGPVPGAGLSNGGTTISIRTK